jgi:ectoine hydroxylase-related dioxygenase (phytanoyl-CoA dioxygenase family)
MLTIQQKAHFDVFGFLAVRQLFTPDEVDTITREFDAAMLEDRDGKPFDGQKRQQVYQWISGRSAVGFLTADQRIHGPIAQLLGPGATTEKDFYGHLYVGDTGWHPDLGWDPGIPDGENDPERIAGRRGATHYIPSIKVAFYLDPVGKESGCLRVIPGAHRNPYHDQLWSLHKDIPINAASLEDVRPRLLEMWERDTGSREGGEQLLSDPKVNHFGLEPRDVPSYPIESEPGDAVFFSHQMWHSSFGGKAGRRMFTLNFRSTQADDGDKR